MAHAGGGTAAGCCPATGDKVLGLALSADGQRLASIGGDQTVKLWDLLTGREVRTWAGHNDPLLCVALSPDGQLVASGGGAIGKLAELKIRNAATGQVIASIAEHTEPVRCLAFSPDGGEAGQWCGRHFADGRDEGLERATRASSFSR